MSMKRQLSYFLVLILILSLLAGCAGADSNLDQTETAPNPQTQTIGNTSSISETWKSYATNLGFSLNKIQQQTISGEEMAALLDELVAYAALSKLTDWKNMYPVLRASSAPLNRYDSLAALYLSLLYIGGDYGYLTSSIDFSNTEVSAIFDDNAAPTWDLFGETVEFDISGWGRDHYGTAGCIYNISRKCLLDGSYPLGYDKDDGSFRLFDNATYADALLAVLRSVEIAQTEYVVSVDDPVATQPSGVLTQELIDQANSHPAITSEDHPRWTGFVLGQGNEDAFETYPREIELSAQWGFNSARLNLNYHVLFSDDAQTVNLDSLIKLDELIAAAIENDIHLDICLIHVPGRSALQDSADYNYTGDFDLFINQQKQELAFNVYRVIAARYKDISNFNLSITPIWEALNKNLSTGLPAPDYTEEDVADFLGKAIDVIRSIDPDRLIIYEPTPNSRKDTIVQECTPTKAVADTKGNVIISYNFCEMPYVYVCMTGSEGRHIDNTNHSMDIPSYPNYIYSVAPNVYVNAPIALDGLLPAGTTIDLYLENSFSGGTLDISEDGVSLYSEKLADASYDVEDRLSGYLPFAVSEKKISVTLGETADEVVISCLYDGGFDLCGIELTFPEEYAQEKWYFAQAYDVYIGLEKEEGVTLRKRSNVMIAPNDYDVGRHITIHEDLSYTSEHVFQEASADTINAWCETVSNFDGNCVIRFERADFSGAVWSDMAAYYEDLLKSFEEYGYSWWSNDWWLMTSEYAQTKVIAECPSIDYEGYEYFNMELLQLLKKYQSKGT